jgi:hypothetical protein
MKSIFSKIVTQTLTSIKTCCEVVTNPTFIMMVGGVGLMAQGAILGTHASHALLPLAIVEITLGFLIAGLGGVSGLLAVDVESKGKAMGLKKHQEMEPAWDVTMLDVSHLDAIQSHASRLHESRKEATLRAARRW